MRLLLIIIALIAAGGPARAWTRPGHMVTAAITYEALAVRNPQALARLVALAGAHPDKGPFEVAVGREVGESRRYVWRGAKRSRLLLSVRSFASKMAFQSVLRSARNPRGETFPAREMTMPAYTIVTTSAAQGSDEPRSTRSRTILEMRAKRSGTRAGWRTRCSA